MSALYSNRVELAITTMLEAHGLHRRKAGRGFEASHVTAVALIAFDHGFDEDTVVAALLHDTLEDTDLAPDLIASRFGEPVLQMVQDVTEPPKRAPWRERKTIYIDQLRATPRAGSLAIASADKIHNLSNMVAGIEAHGPRFISVFTAGLDEMRWYQRTVHDTLSARWDHPILAAHRRQLDAFETAAADLSPTP